MWQDSTTLSSGERHRIALALVLVDKPEWLILDDTFAALDPETREEVAKLIVEQVQLCTLLTASEEYVPNAFKTSTQAAVNTGSSPIFEDSVEESDRLETSSAEKMKLPDPDPKNATFFRSLQLLFGGGHVIGIDLGAVLLSIAEIGFVAMVSRENSLSVSLAWISGLCALAALLGSISFFGVIYYIPIARLGKLHRRVIGSITRFAHPQTSGAVVGRFGEDFSNLQMAVPSALGTVFLVLTQTVLLITSASAGAPLFLLVVVIVVPFVLLLMRQSSKWILAASTEGANCRGDFIDAANMQAGIQVVPTSNGLRLAGERAYRQAEHAYLNSSLRLANAYAARTGLVQLLILLVNSSAVLVVVSFGAVNSWITASAVVYFAVTLSSGIESTVETLQEVGVVGLTVERVRLLEEIEMPRTVPPVCISELEYLKGILDSGCTLVALIGRTGAGKSVMLDALYKRYPRGQVALIPDVDPFASDALQGSGLELMCDMLLEKNGGDCKLFLLDEIFKECSPATERAKITQLKLRLQETEKQAVVVLHSRSNLDCFSRVVDLDE